MKLEKFVSHMLKMNTQARLWHWATDIAQHHTTFETFLTQNESFTDSFVESGLGNDFPFNLKEISVQSNMGGEYSLDKARQEISDYRRDVVEMQSTLEKSDSFGSSELVSILDDAVELCSKSLYLLKLK